VNQPMSQSYFASRLTLTPFLRRVNPSNLTTFSPSLLPSFGLCLPALDGRVNRIPTHKGGSRRLSHGRRGSGVSSPGLAPREGWPPLRSGGAPDEAIVVGSRNDSST